MHVHNLREALVDELGDRGGVVGRLDGGAEGLVGQGRSHLGKNLQVGGTSLGLGNEKGDGAGDRGLVHGLPGGDALGALEHHDMGGLHRIGLGMRDGEALDHARGALCLTLEEGGVQLGGVLGDTRLDGALGDEGQGGVAILDRLAAEHVGSLDEALVRSRRGRRST